MKGKKSLLLLSLTLLATFVWGAGNRQQAAQSARARPGDYSKPVSFSILAHFENAEPDGRWTDPVTRMLEEKFNITLEMITVSDADAHTRLATLLAADDLPDLFQIDDTLLSTLLSTKKIINVDPYLKDYAPYSMSDKKQAPMMAYYRGSAYSPDGGLYVWGMNKGSWDNGLEPNFGFYILWDAYKKAGYPKLDSFRDLPDALEKMVAACPTSISGEKTYGAGYWYGEGQWGEQLMYWVLDPVGVSTPVDGYGGTFIIDLANSTPVMYNNMTSINSPYWENMWFFNKLYQKGLLDPDIVTMKHDEYSARVKDGRYMFATTAWNTSPANMGFSNIPGNERMYISLPSFSHRTENRFTNNFRGERRYAISSKTKNPERIIEFLDYCSTYEFSLIASNGIEGKNWTRVNGRPTPTTEYLRSDRSDKVFMRATGTRIYRFNSGYADGAIDPVSGVPMDLYFFSDESMQARMNNTLKDFIAHYGKSSQREVYESQAAITTGYNLLSFGTPPDDIKSYIDDLSAYRLKNFLKVVMAKDDTDFVRQRDAFIAGMADYHPERIWQYYNDEAAKQTAQVSNLMNLIEDSNQ
ncbi:MAG: extracellular solute-binding protein [Treponema sp.]|jgi:ABC-type glycerol-3-phosphate transport system substrate-binding protein|nr:extracellular solute-binding protein [Treponema sp.]